MQNNEHNLTIYNKYRQENIQRIAKHHLTIEKYNFQKHANNHLTTTIDTTSPEGSP